MRSFVIGAAASARIEQGVAWLLERGAAREVLLVAPSYEAVSHLVREAVRHKPAMFGWQRHTLASLAGALAAPRLVDCGLVPVGPLAIEAVCARVLQRLHAENKLGSLAAIVGRPGLPRALARTLSELRLSGLNSASLRAETPELATLFLAFEEELATLRFADRAAVFAHAIEGVQDRAVRSIPLEGPLLLIDLAIEHALERDLVRALVHRASEVLCLSPIGDTRANALLEQALGIAPQEMRVAPQTALERLQISLFSSEIASEKAAPSVLRVGGDVSVVSAPGESREAVEIARRVLEEAKNGTAFDRMAILLRTPGHYVSAVHEALARARIPSWDARGARRPDPSGRALLTLLACAAEGLSARRFSEYLSLGTLPIPTPEGAPPPAADAFVPPDSEVLSTVLQDAPIEEENAFDDPQSVERGEGKSFRAPRRWEHLLTDAAVLSGRDRWARRLRGVRAERNAALEAALKEEGEGARAEAIRRAISEVEHLEAFAMPLLDALLELPARAPWPVWCERLGAIATRAIRMPDRVLSVLAELAPMGDAGDVDLDEVRMVLGPRLGELVVRSGERSSGRVWIGTPEDARGMAFDVVFVPGLVEKLFPQKIVEDPLLRDAARADLIAQGASLATNETRVDRERLRLHLAVDAARRRLVVSYPRLESDHGRPRVPSFYALEIFRAVEGVLPGYADLAARAEPSAAARMGWPAPEDPHLAIDEAEYDLALLARVAKASDDASIGAAHYLLHANPHLARALRFRGRRWKKNWFYADGLVDPDPASPAVQALSHHQLDARAFSASALQHFSSCPYRFFLHAIVRLRPRDHAQSIEQMDPRQRGDLIHRVQFRALTEFRDAGLLPLNPDRLDRAKSLLDRALEEVERTLADDVAPAIPRVWEDGVQQARKDLYEWLRILANDQRWTPVHFELGFGAHKGEDRDRASSSTQVTLSNGLRLIGSIDLVEEQDNRLRATDHKTGKNNTRPGLVLSGGEVLQPLLYALALECLFPGNAVDGGRLFFCTSAGDFSERVVPLDARARQAVDHVVRTLQSHLREGFFPAAPTRGACARCDYRSICGPHEELRSSRKDKKRLHLLTELRELA